MNIGSMIRGLLGESRAGEARTMELKEGQVVRGVVLSVSETGKEAVVQIQGVPVRAELDTPLQPGQVLNLQVAPPGEGGLPVLKPVSLGDAALSSPQSMGEALELLGLTDSKAGRDIIQAMQSAGLPLTKEIAAKLEAVIQAKPQAVETSEWLEAAVISVKRGLPVTAETVKGLQQAVFGPKLHELLSKLETELAVWIQQEGEEDTAQVPEGMGKSVTTPKAAGLTAITPQAAQSADGEAEAEPAIGRISGPVSAMADEAGGAMEPVKGSELSPEAKPGRVSTAPAGLGAADSAAKPDLTAAADEPTGAGQTKLANQGVSEAAAKQTALPVLTPPTSGNEAADPPAVPGVFSSLAVNGTEAEGALPTAGSGGGIAVPGGSAAAADAQQSAAGVSDSGAEKVAPHNGATSAAAGAEPAGRLARQEGNPLPTRTEAAAAHAASGSSGPSVERSGTALLAKLQGVLTELRGTLPQLAAPPPAIPAGEGPVPAAPQPQGVAAPPAPAGQTAPRAPEALRGDSPAAAMPSQPQGTAATPDTESWVGRVLKLLGAEHEQQAVRAGSTGAREAALQQTVLQSTAIGGEDAADTLKGVLLQVMGSSEVPPAVKEAAGQLVQQLTGQQLLLNTDRTAPFAQVTLFVPLRGENGQETASVHIQSRRGRKGELDAANCRLWFDLDMKQLGQTLVDVRVVDRIVSLKLHNNDPWVLELLAERRNDIQSAVEAIGYQLLSLRAEPLPEESAAAASQTQGTARLADYVPDSYKGVDYRI